MDTSRETRTTRRLAQQRATNPQQGMSAGWFWLAAGLVSFLTVVILFLILGLAPFGTHNLAMSDMGSQYTQFFLMLRRNLIQHSWSSYSFMVGIGDSVVPIYTYYLLSPLNLIVALFPAWQILVAINVILFIKLVLSSLSMITLLTSKFHHRRLFAIAGGLAYSLTGFVAMNFYDIMWLDAVVLLPLIILGVDRLFTNHVWGYLIALTAAIAINYYMGYQICVFVVFYFLYQLARRPELAGARWPVIRRFIGFSALAGLLAAVVLLPTVFAMLSTGKSAFTITDYQLSPTFGPSALAGLGIGTTNFDGHLVHNPAIFVGTTFVVAMLTYFLSNRVTLRAKWTGGGLLAIVVLFMGLRPLNTMWHMFQMPAGFPFRMSYMLGFVIILLAYEAYITGAFEQTRVVGLAAVIAAALLGIGYWFASHPLAIDEPNVDVAPQLMVSTANLGLSVGAIAVAAILLTLIGRGLRAAVPLVVAFVGVEMVTNFVEATHHLPFGTQSRFAAAFQASDTATRQRLQTGAMMTADSGIDNGFYRVGVIDRTFAKAFPQAYSGYNDAMSFNYAGASSYSSTLNSHTLETMRRLGYFSRNERRIGFQGSSAPTAQLLGLKFLYRIGEKPAVTQLIRSASLGYMVNSQLGRTKLREGAVIDNLNALLRGTAGDDTNYFVRPSVTVTRATHPKTYRYRMRVTAKVTGPQYLYIKDINVAELVANRDGQRFSPQRHTPGNMLMSLGAMKAGQSTTVTVASMTPITNWATRFAGLDAAKYRVVQQSIADHQLQLTNGSQVLKNGSNLNGTVTATSQQNLLMVSVPYDKGWHVTVDGHSAPTTKVMDGLLAVKLATGDHRVALHYRPQGLMLGLVGTLIGLVLTVLTAGLRFYRKQ